MNIYVLSVIAAVCAYLAGGVNGAIILSKMLYHEDIREKGSKNPGFTNFKRVYGMGGSALAVMAVDILKTVLPVLVFGLLFDSLFGEWQFGTAFTGLFCMLGHAFPVWYRFKGGKAFLSGATVAWFVDWRMALIAAGIFLLLLFTVHIMSLSSITAAAACPISLAILGPASAKVLIVSVLSALLVVARHHKNIARLIKGGEPRFTLGNGKEKKTK